ncbi:hypothetical protein CFP56_005201, partial [Quercus suber]
PPKTSLDLITPTWFTSSTFLSKDDHRKIVASTNSISFYLVQPPKTSLDLITPTWFTSSTFLSKDDHRKIVASTNSIRPIISFDFWETPIKAIAEDLNGYTVYVGNGCGDLASVDMRTGDCSSIM